MIIETYYCDKCGAKTECPTGIEHKVGYSTIYPPATIDTDTEVEMFVCAGCRKIYRTLTENCKHDFDKTVLAFFKKD